MKKFVLGFFLIVVFFFGSFTIANVKKTIELVGKVGDYARTIIDIPLTILTGHEEYGEYYFEFDNVYDTGISYLPEAENRNYYIHYGLRLFKSYDLLGDELYYKLGKTWWSGNQYVWIVANKDEIVFGSGMTASEYWEDQRIKIENEIITGFEWLD